MPRKPNYDFERKERDRLKEMKKAKRAADKKEAQEQKSGPSDGRPMRRIALIRDTVRWIDQ